MAKSGEKPKRGLTNKQKVEVKALSPQHDRFCREFIVDENQVRSYQRAYPNSSYQSAAQSAGDLLKKPQVQARIEELREERNKRLEISADRVLAEIAKLAYYDPRDFFTDDGRLKPISELDPDHAAVIAGIETVHKIVGDDKNGLSVLTKIKLPDKGVNLERLGRHLKMFTDKVEHSGDITVEIVRFGDREDSTPK